MKSRFNFSFLLLLLCLITRAQVKPVENIVVITLDGMRWQEVFNGADSILTFDTTAIYNTDYIGKKFWAGSPDERRLKLMPFLWTGLKNGGVLFGNRKFDNNVNNGNPYWFSYPGYNEIFTGYPDSLVNSNDKVPNPNENVFEFLNKRAGFKGKTAVFGSWAIFKDDTVIETWNGVYSKLTNGQHYLVVSPDDGVTIINGLGGAGMTLSFGICEQIVNRRAILA